MEKNQNSVFMPHRTTAMFIDVFVGTHVSEGSAACSETCNESIVKISWNYLSNNPKRSVWT